MNFPKHLPLLLSVPALICTPAVAQNWQDIRSIEELCTAYPKEVDHLFQSLNLDYPGLNSVKTAYKAKNLPLASQELLRYYQSNGRCPFLRQDIPEESDATVEDADTILKNIFTVQMVQGQVPILPNGHRNWDYKGPDNNPDWAWLSNRHEQLELVYDTYLQTGNKKYAAYMDDFLRDFIIKSFPYPAVKGGGLVWRGLEISYRAKRWARFFYGMINNPDMLPATKILLLASLPDHAHYNRHFHGQNNWLTMELSALATVASYFPEYKESPEWLAYCHKTMGESMQAQLYPDGVQVELTSHYHDVAARNFEVLKTLADQTGGSIPATYVSTLERMFDYTAKILRPSGHLPLNNDGDRRDRRDIILAAAENFKHPDWIYIVTNGKQGQAPKDGPSYIYPWAGHLISRSGFDADAHWSFFDIGPWGSAHEHSDKLHLSLSAYGRDLLVDSGRFAYMGDIAAKYRGYAISSRAHNTVLIDNKGQNPGPAKAQQALPQSNYKITPEYDYAHASFGSYQGLQGKASHQRMLYYLRGEAWVVIDRIQSDKPRSVQTLWHFHPDCKVVQEGNRIATQNERGNLTIIPLSQQDQHVKLVYGQEQPYLQGWYSEEYNSVEANSVAEYQSNIEGDSTFVWLLYPSEKVTGQLKAEIVKSSPENLHIKLQDGANKSIELKVPMLLK